MRYENKNACLPGAGPCPRSLPERIEEERVWQVVNDHCHLERRTICICTDVQHIVLIVALEKYRLREKNEEAIKGHKYYEFNIPSALKDIDKHFNLY